MTPEQKKALMRLRYKLEVMHFEFRSVQNTRHHDTAEMLALLDIIEKDAG